MSAPAETAWSHALLAAAVHIIAPNATGGIRLKAHAGSVRETWLASFQTMHLPETQIRRMPAHITDSRLLGGLDLAATLHAGKPIAEKGLLADANEGFIIVSMAERLDASTAAKLTTVMDKGFVTTERDGLAKVNAARFGLVALDEGLDDEQPPTVLTERLGLIVDLREFSHRDIEANRYDAHHLHEAKQLLPDVTISNAVISALCEASAALGISSLRAVMQAVQTARALAALGMRNVVSDDDAAQAAGLVLAPRATQIPQTTLSEETASEENSPDTDTQQESPENTPENDSQTVEKDLRPLDEVVLDAALANIPPDLLAALKMAGDKGLLRSAGKAGQFQKEARRGRIIGSKAGDLRSGARLDVIATLRTAAPWQKLRQSQSSGPSRIHIRRDDFRISHYRQRSQTSTIFVVDASGSSALQRLAEAKGAVKLLLSECYVRRDEVALIAFRGTSAEIIMPPTRALVRAQRALAALPGGGGTPIAAGIDAAAALASAVRRTGRTASLVFMTDGRANVGRDGIGGRAEAQDDARHAAKTLRGMGISTILIDTSPKPQILASELAQLMGGHYLPLPQANAARMAQAVSLLQKTPEMSLAHRGPA
jgi:magnesium chelatase subunit D